MSGKRFLIMAGGTGGHIFPALATAHWLVSAGHSVHWLGAEHGMECRLVPPQGFELSLIHISGLRGKGGLALLKAPFKVLRAIIESIRVIRRVKPDCVLGMGGYVTGPGGVAARMLGIPLVIHEQNAIAGTTNRILARLATRVVEAFSGAFSGHVKAIAVGNPVRAEISSMIHVNDSITQARRLRMLVVGGSLGAQAINRVVPEAMALISNDVRPEIRHQSGEKLLEDTLAAYRQTGVEAQVVPFIEDMGAAYQWADVVVCRAGALTISELCAAGRGAILVPFPHAVDDHQTANARYMTKAGAAVLLPQTELNASALAQVVENMMKDRESLIAMAKKAQGLARPDATKHVARICLEVCGG
ncbi:MAG: undecaprenyldiphospho-muramoylpentapeptide beta-N-acetylglucosaminyltransferase [Hahellaceae bacterium]|nr:undecaprenyldiphospho-muramoylpentapeptide beta-N-acetylglucosaminyltransferase [Hahellaceae bacterium]MCP5169855.1 undecaprenyldiphospho-muramoylpentapeptide beta-N-acetylglucosaminyltransferase [Hahellaceae bacterium]